MSMMRWQPFTEMISLRQAMDKLFEDSFVTPVQAALSATSLGNLSKNIQKQI